MNSDQEVKIPLSEYLELKEWSDKRKFVKITEEVIRSNGISRQTGSSTTWRSDGKVWSFLTNKLRDAGTRMGELVRENESIKEMTIWQFMAWRKK